MDPALITGHGQDSFHVVSVKVAELHLVLLTGCCPLKVLQKAKQNGSSQSARPQLPSLNMTGRADTGDLYRAWKQGKRELSHRGKTKLYCLLGAHGHSQKLNSGLSRGIPRREPSNLTTPR